MDGLDLLKELVRRNPELQLRLRGQPTRLRISGRWRTVSEVRPLGCALDVICQDGRRFRLPADSMKHLLVDRAVRLLTSRIRGLWPDAVGIRVRGQWVGQRSKRGVLCHAWVRRSRGPNAQCKVLAPDTEVIEDIPWLVARLVQFWDRPPVTDAAALIIPGRWSDFVVDTLERLSFPVECWRWEAERAVRIFPRERTDSRCSSPYLMLPVSDPSETRLAAAASEFPELDLVFRKSRWELSLLGLPVLWEGPCGLEFEYLDPRPLNGDWEAWRDHVRTLLCERSFPSRDPAAPAFRFAPERWLEALLIRNRQLIRPDMADPFYCQVPTFVEGDRKVIDLLGVTASGRLVVVELKARKSPDLLFQGIEYWQRVWEHQRRGEFLASGYFPGVVLSPEPPLLYLVSPWTEFHRKLGLFRSYLAAEVEIHCIGINPDWKRGPRVVRRFRL